MDPSAGAFDPWTRAGIHFCLGLVCALWGSACKEEPPRPTDAGHATQAPEDEAADRSDGSDGSVGSDGSDEPAEPPRITAEGRVPKGFDMGLARDRAADTARRNLLKKMKDLGLVPPEEKALAGSTVDRFWIQGRFVHAEVSIPWPGDLSPVNVPADVPSNSANLGRPTAAATPEGGPKP